MGLKKPMTPSGKGNAQSVGSSGTKKQLSLMSFFKPMKKAPVLSSPSKQEESDKENDKEHDISMDAGIIDTPMTSEMDESNHPQSSPIKVKADKGKPKMNETPKEPKPEPKSEPKSEPNPEPKDVKGPDSHGRKKNQVNYAESDDEDEEIAPRKRRRVIESDDDEDEDDFKPNGSDEDEDEEMSDFVVDDDASEALVEPEEDGDGDGDEDEEEVIRPKKKTTKSKSSTEDSTSSSSKPASTRPTTTTAIGEKFKANSSYTGGSSSKAKPEVTIKLPPKKNFAKENEERYQWLVNIKDGEKRPMSDPNYDSRTLYIPLAAWAKFTPFEKQYWEVKSTMWDTVVFFKKGKFYELYENDATIANQEFDLKLAGGGRANMKLAGIPEMSFDYWAKEFVSIGYKVARVDQKESMLAKEMRGGVTKEEKIIKRELTGILTGGTLTDLNMISDDMAIYCLSIKEETINDNEKLFGLAFVDTATSELNFIEFIDDNECTKLETLVTQVRPKEVLCEKNNLCSTAIKILKHNNPSQIWNFLNPISEFWDYETTVENVAKSKYYEGQDLDDYSHYPEILVNYQENYKCAFNAFGGLLQYLKSLKLDESVMTLANFKQYDINKSSASHLLLDGVTLNNLEVLNNSYDGSDKGTLLKLLNRAITPFGKRTLKHWILHPLFKLSDINDRYDAIEYLMNDGSEFRSLLENSLLGLPDLERLLARIHGGSLRFKDFLKVVESFEKISDLSSKLKDFSSVEMGSLYKFIEQIPNELDSMIKEWEDAFDRDEALNDVIVPSPGVDADFDDSVQKMTEMEQTLGQFLSQYKKEFKSHEICYRDSGKEIFLIELPNKIKNIPKDWQTMGSTSKVKRYWSPEVKKLVRELLEQRETHKMLCDNLKSNFFKKFDKNYSVWFKSIEIFGKIDCLIALTKSSELIGYPSCRPKFVESNDGFINFKDLRNPVFLGTNEFIPNDVELGAKEPKFGLLTGANAAGKSTVMRTTALAVILSQIGCFIPATSAELSPVDKIMTRLGANDNILQGKSTFFVELSETKKILKNATSNSLIILDELGRGGSSSDGYAIAEAVLYQLSTHIQSMGFFATHFNTLGISFTNHPQIKPLRMGIIVDPNTRNITFLYKLESGTASGSFGMNVASMCGISNDIIELAESAAKTYEKTSNLKSSKEFNKLSLGIQSDYSWLMKDKLNELEVMKFNKENTLVNIFNMITED